MSRWNIQRVYAASAFIWLGLVIAAELSCEGISFANNDCFSRQNSKFSNWDKGLFRSAFHRRGSVQPEGTRHGLFRCSL